MLETAAGIVLGVLALGLLLAFLPSAIRGARVVLLLSLAAATATWLLAAEPRVGIAAALIGVGAAAAWQSPRSAAWTIIIAAAIASAAAGGWYAAGATGMLFAPLTGFAAWAVWDWRRPA